MNLLTERPLILASASPRRLSLLRQVGVEPQVIVTEVTEISQTTAEMPAWKLVQVNAMLKAAAARTELANLPEGQSANHADAVILAADTVVMHGGQLFGKPQDAEQALAMLRQLSASTHTVFTGQCLIDCRSGQSITDFAETKVTFSRLKRSLMERYIAGGEPFDKAGGYGIQGAGSLFVERIEGDYGTAVGLSLSLLARMLQQLEQSDKMP